jgi:hypothetical protein
MSLMYISLLVHYIEQSTFFLSSISALSSHIRQAPPLDLVEITAAHYLAYGRRSKRKGRESEAIQLFSASLKDIQKALECRSAEDVT